MDDSPYISITLDEYIHLSQTRKLLEVLRDLGLDEWEKWPEAVDIFLEEEGEDPDNL